jgi:hypothetical protein
LPGGLTAALGRVHGRKDAAGASVGLCGCAAMVYTILRPGAAVISRSFN